MSWNVGKFSCLNSSFTFSSPRKEYWNWSKCYRLKDANWDYNPKMNTQCNLEVQVPFYTSFMKKYHCLNEYTPWCLKFIVSMMEYTNWWFSHFMFCHWPFESSYFVVRSFVDLKWELQQNWTDVLKL